MTVTQTSTGYAVTISPAERDQLLIALELAAACRRGRLRPGGRRRQARGR